MGYKTEIDSYRLSKFTIDDFPLCVAHSGEAGHVLHSHDFTELVIIESGKGEHQTESYSRRISTGDIIIIPQGIRHGYDNTDRLRLINIIFDIKLIDSPCSDLRLLPGFHMLFVLSPGKQPGRYELPSLSPEELRHVSQLTRRMENELLTRRTGYKSLCTALLTELVTYFSRREPESKSKWKQEGLDKALSYMEQHYKENVSVDTLAKIAGWSPRNFHRVFLKATGQSPLDYILNIRLREARKLLTSGNLSISEAAMKAGFNDSSYFTRQFRQRFGLTPKSYRQANAIQEKGRR